jgi:DNA-binding response OmpR family regulator
LDPRPLFGPRGILVADDDEGVRAVLEAALHNSGFEPHLAENGVKAVDLFRRHKEEVGAVLLDVGMPGLDGPATLVALRGAGLEVPCCFMTGFSLDYTEEDLLALGAARVFAKPFRLDEILATIAVLCGRIG